MIKPVYQNFKSSDGSEASSFRWLGTGWDMIRYKDGRKFIQYGKNPVKFICLTSKGLSNPVHIYSVGWDIHRKVGSLIIGTTTKPINFKEKWDAYRKTTKYRKQIRTLRPGFRKLRRILLFIRNTR